MPGVRAIALGDNTVYLVEDGGERVLVDTGPDYRGAREYLAEQVGPLPDLVLATHGHLDHAGLGAWWQGRGVPVALGTADLAAVAEPPFRDSDLGALQHYVAAVGTPPDIAAEAVAAQQTRWERAQRLSHADYPDDARGRWPSGLRFERFTAERPISGDGRLPAGLQALACPGHTPGNVVAWHAGERWLFSGDQLLPGLTPTPSLQFTPEGVRIPTLPPFVASLERLDQLQPERCFPGHGEPFDDTPAAIKRSLGEIDARLLRVLEELRTSEQATAWGMAEALYPRAARRRFWQVVPSIQGALDLLVAGGLVVEEHEVYRVR